MYIWFKNCLAAIATVLVILTAIEAHAGKKGYYPIKRESVSLSGFMAEVRSRGLDNEEKLARALGSLASDNDSGQKLFLRYVYSPSWGWIDLKHFANAAYQTSKWYLGVKDVLLLGELNEKYEYYSKSDSSYNYEDLVSNLLGAYFEDLYIDEKSNKKKGFIDNLEDFLKAIQVVEEPLLSAPNVSEMPEGYDLKSDQIFRNYTYVPFYTKKTVETAIDRKIKIYRKLVVGQ